MTIEEARRVIGTLRRANNTWTTEQAEALDVALWLMKRFPFEQDVERDVPGYPQSLTELYSFLQHNPQPFTRSPDHDPYKR